MDFDPVTHGIDDLRQHGDGGECAIQLTTAMVGDDDGIGARISRSTGIFLIENALED